MSVNVDGVVLGVLRLAQVMAEGSIVATASLAGLTAMPSDAVYSLTKHAVVGFVRSMAPNLEPLRLNAVCPGIADTPMIDERRARRSRRRASRCSQPEEVADAVWRAATSGRSGECWFVQPGPRHGAVPLPEPARARASTGSAWESRRSDVGRVFALAYDPFLAAAERRGLARERARLLGTLRGRVLEIGAGTGLNVPHYPPDADVVYTEPDPHMAARLRRRGVEVVEAGAESLPFEDASFDFVVSTLVLCTVPDVPATLAEVRRVLKPGGQLVFIEHVRAEPGHVARALAGPPARAVEGVRVRLQLQPRPRVVARRRRIRPPTCSRRSGASCRASCARRVRLVRRRTARAS